MRFSFMSPVPFLYLGFVTMLHNEESLLAAALSVLLLFDLKRRGRSPGETAVVILASAFGPSAEMIAIMGGAWSYSTHAVLPVPLWLFPLWGGAALWILRLGKRLE